MPNIDGNTGQLFTTPQGDVNQAVRDRVTVPLGSRSRLPTYGSLLHQWSWRPIITVQTSIIQALADEERVQSIEFSRSGNMFDVEVKAANSFILVQAS